MTRRARIVTTALGVFALVVVILAVTVVLRKLSSSGRQKDAGAPVSLELGDQLPRPSLWIDVHTPEKAWKFLRTNDWLSRVLADPLGQGMAVGWSGFLGTKGTDLSGAFQGLVLDLVTDKLLTDPFRIIYFSGEQATGTPALVIPHPSSGAQNAYDFLERLSHKGTYRANGCPGAEGGKSKSDNPIVVTRWLIAEQSVFAGKRAGRLYLAKSPRAVVQALCTDLPELTATPGTDLTLSFAPGALGRESQLAAALLGLGSTARLALAIAGDHLEPRGLLGDLSEPARLGTDSPPEPLLKLAPADTGVVLLATLRLPETLTRDSLKSHLGKSYSGKSTTRSVMLLWNPHGNPTLPTEVAVIWPQEDSELLRAAFNGPNRMEQQVSCGYQVLASTGALAGAIQRTCQGKSPSLLNTAPAVVAGMRQPASIGVGLNVGVALSRLLGEAYAADPDSAKKQAPEIDSARRLLEELPFLGFRGAVQGQALVPGGFRS